MSIASSLSFVSSWFKRPRGTVREQEPADLGTAFGLECWLDEDPQEAPAKVGDGSSRFGANALPQWLYGARRE